MERGESNSKIEKNSISYELKCVIHCVLAKDVHGALKKQQLATEFKNIVHINLEQLTCLTSTKDFGLAKAKSDSEV